MYGTIARLHPKTGHEEQVLSLMDQWNRERRPKAQGAAGGYTLRPDRNPSEIVLIALFESRETYRKNADDPEQDRWYRALREHLEADPTWEDGEITANV